MAERMIDETVVRYFTIVGSAAAALCGLSTATMSFLGTLGFNLFNLLDAAVFFGMAYGVYRRSRTCAIILLVYHLGNRLDMYERTRDLSAAFGFFAVALIVAYFLAILGAFAHHAIQREKKSAQTYQTT